MNAPRRTARAYHLAEDPLEQRPRTDFPPGEPTAILERLRAWHTDHPLAQRGEHGGVVTRDLGYEEEMRELGYVGEDG